MPPNNAIPSARAPLLVGFIVWSDGIGPGADDARTSNTPVASHNMHPGYGAKLSAPVARKNTEPKAETAATMAIRFAHLREPSHSAENVARNPRLAIIPSAAAGRCPGSRPEDNTAKNCKYEAMNPNIVSPARRNAGIVCAAAKQTNAGMLDRLLRTIFCLRSNQLRFRSEPRAPGMGQNSIKANTPSLFFQQDTPTAALLCRLCHERASLVPDAAQGFRDFQKFRKTPRKWAH